MANTQSLTLYHTHSLSHSLSFYLQRHSLKWEGEGWAQHWSLLVNSKVFFWLNLAVSIDFPVGAFKALREMNAPRFEKRLERGVSHPINCSRPYVRPPLSTPVTRVL